MSHLERERVKDAKERIAACMVLLDQIPDKGIPKWVEDQVRVAYAALENANDFCLTLLEETSKP